MTSLFNSRRWLLVKRALGIRVLILGIFAGAVPASSAETARFDLEVQGGKHDRNHVPVKASISVPAALAGAGRAVLEFSDGTEAVGQLTAPALLAVETVAAAGSPRELHFFLPKLAAGESVRVTASISDQASVQDMPAFRWQDTPGEHVELLFGPQPVVRYMYQSLDESTPQRREETYKVYHHVYDPTGKHFLTKGPGGLYPHHRGLFYGFNRITFADGGKADTWHCTDGAYQSHVRAVASEAGPCLGRHRVAVGWHRSGGEAFASEERELTVYARRPDSQGTLIEFASRLRTNGGTVMLDGDPQHAGFQFRAAQEVAEKTKQETYYLRPDGAGKPGETRNWDPKERAPRTVNLPWLAMSFVVGGQRYTAVYLDCPSNPKEARYSERDYGRFGSYFEHSLAEVRPLAVRYRVWVQPGEVTAEAAQALSADFVDPVEAMVAKQ